MAIGDDGILKGGCLCGGVQFEIERATGPFELCHCARCRKVSGSAFMADGRTPVVNRWCRHVS